MIALTKRISWVRIMSLISRFIIWLAPWAAKINQVLRCDWLPERARWSYLSRSGLPAVSRKKNFRESHIINPLLIKLVQSRWFSVKFMDPDSVSVHKHARKERGQYPAILTSHLVNNPYIFSLQMEAMFTSVCETLWRISEVQNVSYTRDSGELIIY